MKTIGPVALIVAVLAFAPRAVAAQDESTREMAALLKERAKLVEPARLIFLVNDQRAALAEAALKRAQSPTERLDSLVLRATELFHAGQLEEAIEAFGVVEQEARESAPEKWRQGSSIILLRKAMTYLRLGEEQNCHQGNNPDSCLLPIKGEGVHKNRFGGTHAAEILAAVFERNPQNLSARWLLNVAHMTLGTYPDGVPAAALIPPSAFASDYPLPRFNNVAREAGVDVYGLSGGALTEDFDNDGRLDLMTSAIGFEDRMHYFWNSGDGTFEDRTEKAGLTGETGGLNMVHADYNNDGFTDVVVLRGGWMMKDGHFPLSLLRNNGNGTFTDVTRAAGLIRFAPTQTGAFFDYDNDGWLDLFIGNESTPGDSVPCHLFHNNRDGTFTDVAKEAGVDVVGYVKGVAAGDYDNDGRPDLYLSLAGENNILLHNDGPGVDGKGWRFGDATERAGVAEPLGSFGTFFFDYDNDGWLDLFVAGYGGIQDLASLGAVVAADYLGLPNPGERSRLYRNRRDGTFEDVTKAVGLYKVVPTMGLSFGDLDNDGWLDMYLGTGNPDYSALVPNRMFRNDGGRRFQDVTAAGNFGHLQKGHGVAFADLDNDGDQDVFEEMGGAYLGDKAYSALYENPGNRSHWLSLELQGVRSNRHGIGARVEIVVATKQGPRSIFRSGGATASFGGNPRRLEIGLGDAQRIAAVKILWPATGQTQTISNLKLDRRYAIREGDREAKALTRPSFALGGKGRTKPATVARGER